MGQKNSFRLTHLDFKSENNMDQLEIKRSMHADRIAEAVFMEFASSHPLNNIWQSLMMGEMQKGKGKKVLYLGVFEGSELIGASSVVLEPAHFGKYHARTMRGPLLNYEDTSESIAAQLNAITKFLNKENVLYWTADPYCIYSRRDLDGRFNPEFEVRKDLLEAFRMSGGLHSGFSTGIDNRHEPRWMYIIPLKSSKEEILHSFERKCRRSIVRAKENDITVREVNQSELHLVDELLNQAAKRHNFKWREASYNENLWEAFHPSGAVKFLIAEVNLDQFISKMEALIVEHRQKLYKVEEQIQQVPSKKMENRRQTLNEIITSQNKRLDEALKYKAQRKILPLAAGIFFVYGNEVICLMSGYDEQYKGFCGPYAMHWEMIQYCLNHGLNRYNLYGISGDFSSLMIDRGVYEFKRGFNGEVWELMGEFQFPVDRKLYKAFTYLKALKTKLKSF